MKAPIAGLFATLAVTGCVSLDGMDPNSGPERTLVDVDGTNFTYTPPPGYTGLDTLTYTVCDTTPTCDTATITITVGVAPPPAATPEAPTATPAPQTKNGIV